MKPNAPVIQNTSCQPKWFKINGTISSADTTPMLVPALNIPVANARSFFGNHSDTVFIAAGKFPASPNPNPTLANPKPNALRASACSMPAMLHTTMVIAKPIFVPILSISQPKNNKPAA
jgi:hypothetical protein